MSLAELQKELRERGVRSSGRKADLVSRLVGLDSLRDTSALGPSVPRPSSSPAWPNNAHFRSLVPSLRESLPPLAKEQIEEYVIYRQAQDREANRDVRAMNKGENLCEEGKVQGLSYYEEDAFFFSGLVAASMKKKVTYAIKIIQEKKGGLLFTSCECPAGVGPHSTCKHIVAGTIICKRKCGTSIVPNFCHLSISSQDFWCCTTSPPTESYAPASPAQKPCKVFTVRQGTKIRR